MNANLYSLRREILRLTSLSNTLRLDLYRQSERLQVRESEWRSSIELLRSQLSSTSFHLSEQVREVTRLRQIVAEGKQNSVEKEGEGKMGMQGILVSAPFPSMEYGNYGGKEQYKNNGGSMGQENNGSKGSNGVNMGMKGKGGRERTNESEWSEEANGQVGNWLDW